MRRLITFRRGTGTVGGDLTHTTSVAAQRHKPGDNSSLPVTNAANHYGALTLRAVSRLQDSFQLLEEPVPPHKHRVCGDARHLEQQGLEHDVHWFVRSKSS